MKLRTLIYLFLLLMNTPLSADSTTYTLDLNVSSKAVTRGHLDLRGEGPDGSTLSVNSYYLEKDGQPFYPIVGEFHFARYPADYWEESIRKMKAGGINTVASYVFWNLHEREEGTFDFSGDLDLRRFLKICDEVGLPAIVRIGPFCHGEIRNGGLPDWLYGRSFEVRSNDPEYLAHVDRLYAAIGAQMRGLYFKDGGPVIGIQLENEYQHSAAPWELTYPGAPRELTVANLNRSVTHSQISATDSDSPYRDYGQEHMRRLKDIALSHGMDTPFYTATGWGNAAIVERASLPVMAAYAYPFWSPPKPSPFYLFKDLHASPDYAPVSFEPTEYPSIAAEIGSGIMPLYDRRPYYVEDSLAPLMVRLIGSGSNGIGYYMYHGGSTPVFGRFYSEESSGLPKINYDFQAPIGEFGQVRSHFHSTKLLHFFLESFGTELAPMRTILPPTNEAIDPHTNDALRYAARVDEGRGFVFMHNFQDHLETRALHDLTLEFLLGTESIRIPSEGTFTLPKDSWAIFPIHLEMGSVDLRAATVQPLTVLRNGESERHVFVSFPGIPPEFVFPASAAIDGVQVSVRPKDDWMIVRGPGDGPFEFTVDSATALVVPYAMALQAYRMKDERLVFTDALVLEHDGSIECRVKGSARARITLYPRADHPPHMTGAELTPADALLPSMDTFTLEFPGAAPGFAIRQISEDRWSVEASANALDGLHDVFLSIDYVGDRSMAFIRGELVGDHFFHAKPWEIGLRRFAARMQDDPLIVRFHALSREARFLESFDDAHRPRFQPGGDSLLDIRDIRLIPEYQAFLRWPADEPLD